MQLNELLARSAWAALIVAGGLALYWGWTRWQLRRRPASGGRLPGLESLRPGWPAVLYFTAPGCVPCRTQQRPALERLKAEFAEGLQVIEVDAAARGQLADYWGVLAVPTTFVIDETGQPRRVNHGVAGAARLRRQLAEISRRPRRPGEAVVGPALTPAQSRGEK